jgi:threonine/homoserine/homoserine lactone efflux protein
VTGPGRTAIFVVVAWLLVAVVLLAAQGILLAYVGITGAATLVWLGLRALVRQQRAPSMLDRPPLPERYRVADDLRRPLEDVVTMAEQEAESRL